MKSIKLVAGLFAALALAGIIGTVYIAKQGQIDSLNKRIAELQNQTLPIPEAPDSSAKTSEADNGQNAAGNSSAEIPGDTTEAVKPATGKKSSPAQTVTGAASTPVAPKPKTTVATSAGTRDARRVSDMRRMAAAQGMFYKSNNHYYTCSLSGGDCRGKINNYPVSIPNFIGSVTDPLNSGIGCGKDYTYCGLDNTVETNKFCYYAKLESGGYYTASHAGNFNRVTPPATFDECAGANPLGNLSAANIPAPTTPQARDSQRQTDMKNLVTAQSAWFGAYNRYYTCGPAGGDCKGLIRNYPAAIGSYLSKTPLDPINSGSGCGRDLVYCGIDNMADSSKFCFFAKLEGGGYYTASPSGNYKRSTAPATLADCGLPN